MKYICSKYFWHTHIIIYSLSRQIKKTGALIKKLINNQTSQQTSGQNVDRSKCRQNKMSTAQNVVRTKCRLGKLSKRLNKLILKVVNAIKGSNIIGLYKYYTVAYMIFNLITIGKQYNL